MDHVVYLDAAAKELENLLSGHQTMVVRGAAGRKMPYGRVHAGDRLYFLNNNAEGLIRASATVSNVLNEALTGTVSQALLQKNQTALNLTIKQLSRWGGKRYLVLIEVCDVEVQNHPSPLIKAALPNG